MKYQGFLVYDKTMDRMDICLGGDKFYGGLHCGKTMDVKINGRWKPTRIEYGDGWYLVGINRENIEGLTVRMECLF